MKKIFLAVVVALFSINAMAQHEIGAVVGGLNGLSYKYWFSDNLALQADLAVGLTVAAGQGASAAQYDFTLNPNVAYHFDLVDNLKLYTGGGINFGLCSALENTDPNGLLGKFGINAMAGLAYELDAAPLVLAFDFRPGYGMSFRNATGHFFDWKLAFAVRYKL